MLILLNHRPQRPRFRAGMPEAFRFDMGRVVREQGVKFIRFIRYRKGIQGVFALQSEKPVNRIHKAQH